jgi:hypothetical protein
MERLNYVIYVSVLAHVRSIWRVALHTMSMYDNENKRPRDNVVNLTFIFYHLNPNFSLSLSIMLYAMMHEIYLFCESSSHLM